MISSDCEITAIQVVVEVFDCSNYRQEFPAGNTILLLWLGQDTTEIPNNTFHAILDLGQHSTQSFTTGISVKNEVSLILWIGQNGWGCESFFQGFKGSFTVVCPPKLDAQLCSSMEWTGDICESPHKTTVVRAQAYKTSHLLWVLQGWPSSDSCNFLRICSHSIFGDHMTQIFNLGTEQLTFGWGELEIGLLESCEHLM